jgi:hypothetical protein
MPADENFSKLSTQYLGKGRFLNLSGRAGISRRGLRIRRGSLIARVDCLS